MNKQDHGTARRIKVAVGTAAAGLGLAAVLVSGGLGGSIGSVAARNLAQPTASAPLAAPLPMSPGRPGDPADGRGPGRPAAARGGLIVAGVADGTITALRGGTTLTIAATGDTAYVVSGQAGSVADIVVGGKIKVEGTAAADGTITANRITVDLPHVDGVVTAIGDGALTLARADGAVSTVAVASDARYVRAGSAIQASDLATGDVVKASGPIGSDGSLAASVVEVKLPTADWIVTAISGDTLTVLPTGRAGGPAALGAPMSGTETVTVSGETVYVAHGTSGDVVIDRADVAIGTRVHAEGMFGGDGTFAAVRVRVELPKLDGRVVALNGNTLTVGMGPDAAEGLATVAVDDQTTYLTGDPDLSLRGSLSGIAVGTRVHVEGRRASDGGYLATTIRIDHGPRP